MGRDRGAHNRRPSLLDLPQECVRSPSSLGFPQGQLEPARLAATLRHETSAPEAIVPFEITT